MRKVCRQYGFDKDVDEEIAGIALDFLDEAVQDMNSHLYEFNKRIEEIDLVAEQQDYVLTGGSTERGAHVVPYKESIAFLAGSSGENRIHLTYVPWFRFQDMANNRLYTNTGEPSVYSFRALDNDGKISLYPKPSNSYTSHTLTAEYYIRLPLISSLASPDTAPYIPEEVEIPLLYNAMKRMAVHLHGPGHKDVVGFQALETKAVDELQAVDKRHPDGGTRFMVVDHMKRGTRDGRKAEYIKV